VALRSNIRVGWLAKFFQAGCGAPPSPTVLQDLLDDRRILDATVAPYAECGALRMSQSMPPLVSAWKGGS
jgi:hypothetical protein